jgi:peptide/nickel transport system ATP-binding protein
MTTPSDPANGTDVLVTARDLHTWYELRRWGLLRIGDVRAVDGVNFQLIRGEAVAFVGESGCGKSSLARTLLGLTRPTAGTVSFQGVDLAGLRGAELHQYRASVGYVQQDPYGALPPFMTIGRLLEEPLIIHGVRKRSERLRRVAAVLEEVRLTPAEEHLSKFPHMLSGGQQQRVAIARALILRPAMIVADEPVSMLDASVRAEILQLLKTIQSEYNLTLAFITHDLSTVRYFASRIFVMYAGKIVEQAAVDELLRNPAHPYTRALLDAIPDPEPGNAGRIREVPVGEPPSLLNPPSGCRYHPRCPEAMAGLCDTREPEDFVTGDGHIAACWLHAPERD